MPFSLVFINPFLWSLFLWFLFPSFSFSSFQSLVFLMARAFAYVPITNLDSDAEDEHSPSLSAEERERAADVLLPRPVVQIPAFWPAEFKKTASIYTSEEDIEELKQQIIITKDGYDDRLEVKAPSEGDR